MDDMLIELFREDAGSQLEALAEAMVEAESAADPVAALTVCMRAAHSLKGAARVVGLDTIVEVAHAMEDGFEAARQGRIRLDPTAWDRLLDAIDRIRQVAGMDGGGGEPADEATIAALVDDLRAIGRGEAVGPGARGPAAVPVPVEPGAAPEDAAPPEDASRAATEPPPSADRVAAPAAAEAADAADVAAGGSADAPTGGRRKKRSSASPDEPAGLETSAEPGAGESASPRADEPEGTPSAGLAAPAPTAAHAPAPAAPTTAEPVATPAPTSAPSGSDDHGATRSAAPAAGASAIKVSPEVISRLMSLSAEVSVQLRQLERQVDRLGGVGRTLDRTATLLRPVRELAATDRGIANALRDLDDARGSLVKLLEELEQLSTASQRAAEDLHHDVLATRLRPFGDITTPLPRLVRDLARQLGKQVRLEILGKETEVDRDILVALDAPLGHLLRNALDHALEPPEERIAAGKPEECRLTVSAVHRGGALVVEVRDDGRGINVERVRAKAIDRGLVDATLAASLDEEEVLEFLFLPGFSTAKEITDVSGRGVGLDVVQAMAHAAGGSARVTTRAGQGTTFALHLPVTRSVLRCLLVRIAGEPWAIPLSHVDRLMRIAEDELLTVEGRHCVRVDENTVGLVSAASVLELSAGEEPSGSIPAVILTDRREHHGLEVDGFIGERDLVVRPLDRRFGKVPDILAAALLDDGTPVLILDPDDLVRSIGEGVSGNGLRRMGRGVAGRARAKRILVVDDSLTVREVERQLLERQGWQVDQAVDGMAGWNALRLGDYDLLLSDVDMPRMTGIELTRKVRGDPRLSAIPIVIVSYKDREEDRLAGLEAGADRYLTKSSFTDDSLVGVVAELLAGAER